jgi:hypothetical protein
VFSFLLVLLGAVAAYFVLTFGVHAYRMRTDPDYWSKVEQEQQECHLRQKVDRLLSSPPRR